MLTTAGATFLTSGGKVRPICSREVGTVCAPTGPAANSRTAANARAQRRKRRSSIDEDLTRTAKGSRTPAASHLSPSCQGLAQALALASTSLYADGCMFARFQTTFAAASTDTRGCQAQGLA